MDNPCFKCTDRVLGCHSTCIKYIDWKQAQAVLNQKIRAEKELEYTVNTLNNMSKHRKHKKNSVFYKKNKREVKK